MKLASSLHSLWPVLLCRQSYSALLPLKPLLEAETVEVVKKSCHDKVTLMNGNNNVMTYTRHTAVNARGAATNTTVETAV